MTSLEKKALIHAISILKSISTHEVYGEIRVLLASYEEMPVKQVDSILNGLHGEMAIKINGPLSKAIEWLEEIDDASN